MPQANGQWTDRELTRPTDGQVFDFSILIVGGSTAAYAATLGALQAGAILPPMTLLLWPLKLS